MKIPKIIHQIWSNIYGPLPLYLEELGETWKRDYPEWEYILWDNKMMVDFVTENYPQYLNAYEAFPYHVQRWDAIRYLILDKLGGMYVDFDYESISPLDKLIHDKTCCFAEEPYTHKKAFYRNVHNVFNNALMLSIPGHFFMKKIIENVFPVSELQVKQENKNLHVLMTTGPWLLIDLYYQLTSEEKKSIYLIPAEYVTPFDHNQAQRFRQGEMSDELENCVQEAYAVHYFFGDWRKDDK